MNENRKVIIDAGHGGPEPGAVYNGRKEKNDTLRLAFDLGNSSGAPGGSRYPTSRVEDVYDTPYEKAAMGNQSGADFFVSIHRNAMPVPGTGSGSKIWCFLLPAQPDCWEKTSVGSWRLWAGQIWASRRDRAWWSYAGRKCRRCWWKPDFLTMKRTTPF